MAPRAHREPAWPRERRTSPPALRGAPGAKGDRLRIRWTPPGAPDGRNSSIPAELCSHGCTTPDCILPAHDLRMGSGRCDAPRRLTMASLLLLLAGLHAHGLRNHQPARDEGCNIRANINILNNRDGRHNRYNGFVSGERILESTIKRPFAFRWMHRRVAYA